MDCERIQRYLVARGLSWQASPEDADYAVVCTCGLSRGMEDASVDSIRDAQRRAREVIVYGCLPAMNPARIEAAFSGKVIPTLAIGRFEELFPEPGLRLEEIPDASRPFSPPPSLAEALKRKIKGLDLYRVLKTLNTARAAAQRVRTSLSRALLPSRADRHPARRCRRLIDCREGGYFLRISEGCRGACRYCAIRKAIGPLVSKPLATLLHELDEAIADRRFSVNIVSSDSGSYGLDHGSTFPDLLRAILEKDRRLQIAFVQDLHPAWISRYEDALVPLVATGRVVSILTAVQSGSPRVLDLMGRRGGGAPLVETLRRLRRACPGLRLRTQVIVGFPTETDEDFRKTVDFLRAAAFDEVDVFPYHETPLMESSTIDPKVPKETILSRIGHLTLELPLTVSTHVMPWSTPDTGADPEPCGSGVRGPLSTLRSLPSSLLEAER